MVIIYVGFSNKGKAQLSRTSHTFYHLEAQLKHEDTHSHLFCNRNPNLSAPTMAAGGYDYEDGLQSSVDGGIPYDPSFVPDPVKTFVVHLYRHIREKNVYEIHQMYETSFHTLSDRMFKDTPWPSVEAVAQYVDNDHVFCLLYREMWYRHLYARLSPTLKQRIDSWDNYCSLFQARLLYFLLLNFYPLEWFLSDVISACLEL